MHPFACTGPTTRCGWIPRRSRRRLSRARCSRRGPPATSPLGRRWHCMVRLTCWKSRWRRSGLRWRRRSEMIPSGAEAPLHTTLTRPWRAALPRLGRVFAGGRAALSTSWNSALRGGRTACPSLVCREARLHLSTRVRGRSPSGWRTYTLEWQSFQNSPSGRRKSKQLSGAALFDLVGNMHL